jgi:hypothetical protein
MRTLLRLAVLVLALSSAKPADACFAFEKFPGIDVEFKMEFAHDVGDMCVFVGIKIGGKLYNLEDGTRVGLAKLGWASASEVKRRELAAAWIKNVVYPIQGGSLVSDKPDSIHAKTFYPLVADTTAAATRVRYWRDVTTFGGMMPTEDFTYVETEVTFGATGAIAIKGLRTLQEPIALPPAACSAKPFAGVDVNGRFQMGLGCKVEAVVIGGKRYADHDAALRAGLVHLGWAKATVDQRKQLAMKWYEEVTGRMERFHVLQTSPVFWAGQRVFHAPAITEQGGAITIEAWIDFTWDDRVHHPLQHTYAEQRLVIDATGAVTRTVLAQMTL